VNLIEDFGGEGEIFHFAHANAYPLRSYISFLNQFTDNYNVIGMNQRPMWSDSNPDSFEDWVDLADDLIDAFDENNVSQVIGAGHSMGAIATLIASIKRPDLFTKIILIDPVILPLQVYEMMKGMSFQQKSQINPLLNIALKRRNKWTNEVAARDYFESKTFFKRFTESAKRDFIEHGIRLGDDDTYTLAYSREWEARIYGTSPSPWEYLKNIAHPCLIVRAEHSDVITSEEAWMEIKQTAVGSTCIQIDGAGHLIPQETPEKLYKRITEFL